MYIMSVLLLTPNSLSEVVMMGTREGFVTKVRRHAHTCTLMFDAMPSVIVAIMALIYSSSCIFTDCALFL